MYLKRAALQRLNARLVNKKSELEGGLLRTNFLDLAELEPSTLTALDRYHISRWSQGLESGRACMLAVLDHRLRRAANDGENANAGTVGKSDIELSLLCASVNLPDDFLSDSGYLFTRIFSKAPVQVIREALEMLKDKAQEQSIDELDCDQINMAIKQIRIDIFAKAVADGSAAAAAADAADGQQENLPNSSASVADTAAKAKAKQQLVRDEELRLQVLVELIRLHIAATNPAESKHPSDEAHAGFLPEAHILVDDLSRHLSTPLDCLEAKALGMEPTDLERSNVLLKPYITQLAGLRATLQQQLKALEENAAFYSLGLDRGAASSDAQIKRAYHSLAVRLHPDKGGDTAKFQALQDAYQEVLRRKKGRSAAEGSLDDDSGTEAAQHVVALVAAGVEAVQRAAAQTTALAQRNIRLMKDIEAATTGPGADTVTALRRLQRILGTREQQGNGEKGKRNEKHTGRAEEEEEAESDEDSLERWMREMDAREPKPSVSSSPLPGRSKVLSDSESEDEGEEREEGTEGDGIGARCYNLEELSAKQAVEPLESICEHLQLLAAKAMELPSCGSRYGMATARSTAFVEGVERSMAAGLASLKTTSSLSLADTQVSSSVLRLRFATLPSPNKGRGRGRGRGGGWNGARNRRRRTRAAKRLLRRDDEDEHEDENEDENDDDDDDDDDDSALGSDWDSDSASGDDYGHEEDEEDEEEHLQEEEFRSILVEMLVTAFRSSSVTINIAAERAMSAVVAATSLHGALVDIVTAADEERREQARRASDAAESEAHLSAEDREMIGQMKRQAMAKENKEHDAARAAAKEEEDEKRKREEEEDAEDASGLKALGRLKEQIQSLQVQLHLQHVRTLHSLNSEARGLQQQLHAKLFSLPSEGRADVVVLVADLVDSSYAELRLSDLSTQQHEEQENYAAQWSVGGARAQALLREVKAHLGWLALLGEPHPQPPSKQKQTQEEDKKDQTMTETAADAQGKDDNPLSPPPPHSPQQEQKGGSSSPDAPLPPPQPSSSVGGRDAQKAEPASSAPILALLPDYRSRLLHMALLLQGPATLSLLDVELRERLVGLALTLPMAPTEADGDEEAEQVRQRQAPQRAALVVAVNAFCDSIVLAASALHTQANQTQAQPSSSTGAPDKM